MTALDAAMATWSFLWDRRPALYCPSCHRADTILIRAADGSVVLPGVQVTALALVLALTSMGAPLVDGVRAVPANDYECPALPGDGAGDNGYGPRWNADLPDSVTRWTQLVSDAFNGTCAPWVVDDALHIIACESVGDPDAYNGSTGVSGSVPDAPRLAVPARGARVRRGVSAFDPHANAALAAWLWKTTGGWSHWACRPMPTVNGADPWLIILMAVLTFALVIVIGIIISIVRHEDHD